MLYTLYMAGRAKTECKICKTVVMRARATNRRGKTAKQLTLIPTIGVRTGAVSGRRHLHFGHINWQAEDGKRLEILLGQSPTMPRSLLGSIYQLQLALIRFK